MNYLNQTTFLHSKIFFQLGEMQKQSACITFEIQLNIQLNEVVLQQNEVLAVKLRSHPTNRSYITDKRICLIAKDSCLPGKWSYLTAKRNSLTGKWSYLKAKNTYLTGKWSFFTSK